MSRKRRLESLAQLGQLTDKDLKAVQAGLKVKAKRNRARVVLWIVAVTLAIANAVQGGYILYHCW